MEKIPSVQIDIETGWRGGQRQVELLCLGLARRGHPVTLFTRPGSILGDRLAGEEIDVVRASVAFEFDPFAVRKLVSMLRQKNPSVVGMHASHSHMLGVIAKKFLAPGPKFVVTRRVDFAPGTDLINRWKYVKAPDGYIAISQAVRDVLTGAGVDKERIHRVYSGVTPRTLPADARALLLAELGASPDALLIGTVASLVDHKGHRFLIDAIPKVIEKHPNALFVVAGDGELSDSLKQQAGDLGLTDKNLQFLGFREDVGAFLGALDLYVMTSHLEGLNTSIIDAQLAGVPVVATRAGGIPELVLDPETGWLADNRSPADIAAKILQALAAPDQRLSRAKNAKARAAAQFTADAMVEGTLAAYRKILCL